MQCILIGIAWMTAMSATPALGVTYYVSEFCGNDAWDGTTATCQVPNGPKKTIHNINERCVS